MPRNIQGPLKLVARLVHDRLIGFDKATQLQVPLGQQQRQQRGRAVVTAAEDDAENESSSSQNQDITEGIMKVAPQSRRISARKAAAGHALSSSTSDQLPLEQQQTHVQRAQEQRQQWQRENARGQRPSSSSALASIAVAPALHNSLQQAPCYQQMQNSTSYPPHASSLPNSLAFSPHVSTLPINAMGTNSVSQPSATRLPTVAAGYRRPNRQAGFSSSQGGVLAPAPLPPGRQPVRDTAQGNADVAQQRWMEQQSSTPAASVLASTAAAAVSRCLDAAPEDAAVDAAMMQISPPPNTCTALDHYPSVDPPNALLSNPGVPLSSKATCFTPAEHYQQPPSTNLQLSRALLEKASQHPINAPHSSSKDKLVPIGATAISTAQNNQQQSLEPPSVVHQQQVPLHQDMMSLFEEMLEDEPPLLLKSAAAFSAAGKPAAPTPAAPSGPATLSSSLKRRLDVSHPSSVSSRNRFGLHESQAQPLQNKQLQGHLKQQQQPPCFTQGETNTTIMEILSRTHQQQHYHQQQQYPSSPVAPVQQAAKRQKLNSKPLRPAGGGPDMSYRPDGNDTQGVSSNCLSAQQGQSGMANLHAFAFGSGRGKVS